MHHLIIFFLLLYGLCSAQTDSCSFFGNKPIYPYYYPEVVSVKDFYTVKNEFKKTITAKTDFDGMITIIFFINYKGEAGFYRTQVCNADYSPLEIGGNNRLLCEQALQAVKQAGPWKPAFDKERGVLNSRKFYSFRFKQGALVDILPK